MIQVFSIISLIFIASGLSSCATGFMATGAATTAYVANQENSLSQQAKDLHIKANIKDKLIQKKLSYLKDVEVNVVNSEVLLLGIVGSAKEKRAIYDDAAQAKYVKRIYNKLVLDNQYSVLDYMEDSFISNIIRSRLVFSENTYLSKVDVEVFNNVVYIFGVVGNDEEKYYAEQIARTGKGVISVFSFVYVKRS